MTPRRGLLLTLAASSALALAGCGGEGRLSKSEYQQRVRSTYAEVQQAFRATAAPSPDLLGARVTDAQEALRRAADTLEASEPPRRVERENEELVEGLRRYSDDLDELRRAAERGDLEAVDDFNDRVAQNGAIEQMAEAVEEMTRKGFDLGALAEE